MARCTMHDIPIINEECEECVAVAQHVQQLKEKLDKIRIIFDDESVGNDTFFPKLEKILGSKN